MCTRAQLSRTVKIWREVGWEHTMRRVHKTQLVTRHRQREHSIWQVNKTQPVTQNCRLASYFCWRRYLILLKALTQSKTFDNKPVLFWDADLSECFEVSFAKEVVFKWFESLKYYSNARLLLVEVPSASLRHCLIYGGYNIIF